jgi:hypothetical protein
VTLLAFVLFWVGFFGTVREWRYATKQGLTITRGEKVYLALVIPIFVGAQLVMDLAGVRVQFAALFSVLGMGLALSGWAMKRRIQRSLGGHRPP